MENANLKINEIMNLTTPSDYFNYPSHLKDDDELYSVAKRVVLENKKASTLWLQRMLRVEYLTASSLIKKLEKNKVIGPSRGVKPRKVLIAD